jgi:hypothetical protein
MKHVMLIFMCVLFVVTENFSGAQKTRRVVSAYCPYAMAETVGQICYDTFVRQELSNQAKASCVLILRKVE